MAYFSVTKNNMSVKSEDGKITIVNHLTEEELSVYSRADLKDLMQAIATCLRRECDIPECEK